MNDQIENILQDRYIILKQIGSGGMSNVYCALDTSENKYVTIKVLKPELFKQEPIREMFRKEAGIALQLQHENTIQARDIVEDDQQMYIILDYVEGINLKDYIKRRGVIAEDQAISIALQIARALRYSHNKGFVHKDVKPQNIILDKERKAFLTDFGLAGDRQYHVSESVVLGSVYYFSPEHAKGSVVTPRSDIYSLGIVLYEMLTGKLPFTGESTKQVIMKQLHEDPTSPIAVNNQISVAISQVVMKAIEKDPEYRYVNFNAFIADLKKAQGHPEGGFVKREAVPLAQEKAQISWKKILIGSGVVLGVFALLFLISFVFREESPVPTTDNVMPNLKNMTQTAAVKKLDELGLYYTIEYYEDEKYENGLVVHQSIKENTEIQKGDSVRIGIALNSKNTMMPNFYSTKLGDAQAYLEDAGISEVQFVYVESPLPYNYITKQEPEAGTSLEKIKSVKLYLSNNQAINTVPNVKNLTIEKARDRLIQKGFNVGIVYEDATRTINTIYNQLPEGEQKSQDVYIDLWIGKDPAKTVRFRKDLDITVKQDETKVRICYEDESGILYYISEYIMRKGVNPITVEFTALTDQPKNIHIFFDGIRQNVIENVQASES